MDVKKEARRPRGREARLHPLGTPPPSWAPRSSTDLLLPPIYISIYPENVVISRRSHLGAFSGAPPEGESITEGFYINTIASPMIM